LRRAQRQTCIFVRAVDNLHRGRSARLAPQGCCDPHSIRSLPVGDREHLQSPTASVPQVRHMGTQATASLERRRQPRAPPPNPAPSAVSNIGPPGQARSKDDGANRRGRGRTCGATAESGPPRSHGSPPEEARAETGADEGAKVTGARDGCGNGRLADGAERSRKARAPAPTRGANATGLADGLREAVRRPAQQRGATGSAMGAKVTGARDGLREAVRRPAQQEARPVPPRGANRSWRLDPAGRKRRRHSFGERSPPPTGGVRITRGGHQNREAWTRLRHIPAHEKVASTGPKEIRLNQQHHAAPLGKEALQNRAIRWHSGVTPAGACANSTNPRHASRWRGLQQFTGR